MPERRRAALLTILVLAAGCAIRAPAATEQQETTPRPTPTPSPTTSASASASAVATPTPTPDPALMDLMAITCPGGVVLDWTASTNPDFHHYIALRSMEREIAPDYPPIEPAVDWGDTYATDRFVTAAVDDSILPSDFQWYYRVMAYDARGRAVAASPARDARQIEELELGTLEAEAGDDGTVSLTWDPYRGSSECFTAYRVLAGSAGGPLSTLTVVSSQDADSLRTDALHAGATYQLRVQAVRTTTLGSFVVAETEPLSFTVP